MSGFRLHIDIPLPLSEDEALRATEDVIGILSAHSTLLEGLRSRGVPQIGYRLGHDEDRQRSNYLLKTPSGHVTTKKCKIQLQENSSEQVG